MKAMNFSPRSTPGFTSRFFSFVLFLLTVWLSVPAVPVYALSGDINHDLDLNVTDAVLALQVMSDIPPTEPVYLDGDINGDAELGLAEAIFALQVDAEIRELSAAGNIPCIFPEGILFATILGGSLAFVDYSNGDYFMAGEPSEGLMFASAYISNDNIFYIADVSFAASNLKTYKPLTGETTLVGQIKIYDYGAGVYTPVLINDIAYNPARNILYGVVLATDGSTKQLVTIDRTTGLGFPVGYPDPIPLENSIRSFTVRSDGVMFAALENNESSEQLVQININSAGTDLSVEPVGIIESTPIVGMVFQGGNNIVASHPISDTETELLMIDPESGAKAVVSSVPKRITKLSSVPVSPTGWTTPYLVEVGGRDPALAVDQADNVHITYAYAASRDFNDDRTLFKYWNAKSCFLSTVDTRVGTGTDSSLTVDADNILHASYSAEGLVYAKREYVTGSWDLEQLLLYGVAEMTSITTDTNNKVQISHYGDGTLEYMTNMSGEWELTTIDSSVGYSSWGNTTIATDSAGKMHIVYYDDYSKSIKYATNKSDDWTISIIVQSTTVGAPTNERSTVLSPSLAIDADDNLHVSYMFQRLQTVSPWALLENSLRYATTKGVSPGTGNCGDGSDWNCSFVDEGGLFPSIAIDDTNNVRISHFYLTVAGIPIEEEIPYTLKQAKLEESGAWSSSNVLSIRWSLQILGTSMDIDSNDKSHIAYTIMDHFAGVDEARVYYVRER